MRFEWSVVTAHNREFDLFFSKLSNHDQSFSPALDICMYMDKQMIIHK